jgi:hypothetical protein
MLSLAIALAAVFAALQLCRWPVRVRYPGEFEVPEGIALAETTLLREGEPVYEPATAETFRSMIYGPLFYLLGSRLVDPQEPAYQPLRILAMFAALALAGACGLLAGWITKSQAAVVLGSLMFLAFSSVTRFAVSARPDTVALLLCFSGFLVAYRFRDSNRILWSIPFMVLGAYYKQQFMVAPLAVLLFLVLEKRYRTALQFAALLGAAGLSLLAAFEFVVFRRQSFLLHFVIYNVLPFSLWEGLARLLLYANIFLIPCVMAAWFLRWRSDRLLACYLGCALVLLPLMISKKGAGPNFVFEPLLIACPLVAGYVIVSMSRPERAAAAIALLGAALWLGRFDWHQFDPSPQDFAQERAVQTFLRVNFPPQTPGLGHFAGDLLRAGLRTPITDLYQYSWLICEGAFKDQTLVAQIRQRRFGVIMLAQDLTSETAAHSPRGVCLTEPVHQAILQNYRLSEKFEFQLWDKRQYYAWVRR